MNRNLELSNHFGNVHLTISYMRTVSCVDEDSTLRYEPVSVTSKDYYPFCSPMVARVYGVDTSVNYRFGFNGKENTNELYGYGNGVDFGARIYDPRIGRWLSVDKEFTKGPAYSPYNSFLNNPLLLKDPNGNWVEVSTTKFYKAKNGELKVKNWYNIFKTTNSIQIKMVIGDVRFIDATNGNDSENPLTSIEKKQIINNYKDDLIKNYGNRTIVDEYDDKKAPIAVQLTFDNEDQIYFVKGFEELSGNEEVVVIGKLGIANGVAYAPYGNRSLMVSSKDDALTTGRDGGTFAHEFTHQRNRDGMERVGNVLRAIVGIQNSESGDKQHHQGGVYNVSWPLANCDNAKNLKKDSKGIKLNHRSTNEVKEKINPQ